MLNNIKFADPIYCAVGNRYEVVIPIRPLNYNNVMVYSLTTYLPTVVMKEQLFASENDVIAALNLNKTETKDVIELPHTD